MNKDDIIDLLRIDSRNEIEELFSQARKTREKEFCNKIFMYGFVYFSTWCRNNCSFCYYRKSNRIERYRKEPEKIVAILRLMYPKMLIPASLDIDGILGLEERLNTGANVVTSIIPPKTGLAGVAQNSMDVDEGGRTVEEASQILGNMGLRPAAPMEYQNYLAEIKKQSVLERN